MRRANGLRAMLAVLVGALVWCAGPCVPHAFAVEETTTIQTQTDSVFEFVGEPEAIPAYPAEMEAEQAPAASSEPRRIATQSDYDNDFLFEEYVLHRMDETLDAKARAATTSKSKEHKESKDPKASNGANEPKARRRLDNRSRALYDALLPRAIEVANGQRGDTRFTLSLAGMGVTAGPWSAVDLGVSELSQDGLLFLDASERARDKVGDLVEPAVQALLDDHGRFLYWYDETVGCEVEFSYAIESDGIEPRLSVTDVTIAMSVAPEYAVGNLSGTTSADPAIPNSVSSSLKKAQEIVDANKGKTVYERLRAYARAICDETAYDEVAASGGNSMLPHLCPWLIVSVFDGDPATRAVCEGYAKAFKYLCDLTWSPKEDGIVCRLVTGPMTGGSGAGLHMWNVMSMDDGRNYLVDVTNCDKGTVGEPDKLLLAYKPRGSYDTKYTFDLGDESICYQYDEATRKAHGEAALTLSNEEYVQKGVTRVAVPVAAKGLVYNGKQQTGVAAGKGYTLSGTTKAKAAGTYKAVATPNKGYVWKDKTSGPKTIAWSIAPAKKAPAKK